MKAILTGHSKGLGLALGHELLARQIPVLAIARGQIDALAGQSHLCTELSLDLSDGTALAAWLATPALASYLQSCTEILLINNAGTVHPVGAMADQDPAEVSRAVALNVAAPLMLAAAVVKAAAGRPCRIVHVSSGAGSGAYPGWSVYCAAKAALDHHARAAALDASPGVSICSLAPGVIDTAMQADIRATPATRFPQRQRFVDLHASGQLSAPSDCARRLVDYLLADTFGRNPVDDLRSAGNS